MTRHRPLVSVDPNQKSTIVRFHGYYWTVAIVSFWKTRMT
jgi:hypothetical protein